MPLYRKKPVVIEAEQWDGDNILTVSQFMNGTSFYVEGDTFKIHTLEGIMGASPNDYIIKGISGEFYPCKPDIFKKTYERIGGDQ